jgi:hypothetical protein
MDTVDVQSPAHIDDPRQSAATVALAEFSALRNEIDNLANAHRFMMNLNLTVVVGIVGFVLADKADPHLLFVLPIASSAVGLVYQWYVVHAMHIGDYINDRLRPILVERTRNEHILGWETHLREVVYARRGSALAGRLAYLLLFPAVPAISLLVLLSYLDSIWYTAAWIVGAALVLTQVVLWLLNVRRWVCWT